MTDRSISIIVPVYQPESFDALIGSINGNQNEAFEWILVDDGSGPTFDPVFKYLRDHPVHIIRLEDNRRQAAARNVGLRHATGKWVKFLDADDELGVGHIEALLDQAKRERGLPFAPTRHVYADGSTTDNESWRDLPKETGPQLERLIHSPFLHHCGALFPRDLLLALNGYDESLITDEDGDLLIRVLQAGEYFVPVPYVHYHYRHDAGPGRVSIDAGQDKLKSRLSVCKKFELSFSNRGVDMPQPLRHAVALRLDKIALSFWKTDRQEARKVLAMAQAICPGYRPPGGRMKRWLRAVGGPSALVTTAKLYRRFRQRPAGGLQG